MKALIIFSLSIAYFSLTANELKWVDEQIQAIKPSRSGISKATVNAIKNPFIYLSKEETVSSKSTSIRPSSNKDATSSTSTKNIVKKQSKTLKLHAIINSSALINGKWYMLNDKIGKYTLSAVNGKNIILSYKKKKLYLSTVSKVQSLKFKSN